jgi:hypothetical protein
MLNATDKKPRVLISYAHEDKQTVDELVRQIREIGIDPFTDEKIEFGKPILVKILENIKNSSHLLVYISPASLRSQWVLCEIGMALASDLRIVAYLDHPSLEQDVPATIKDLKYITNSSEFKDFLNQLKESSLNETSEASLDDTLFHDAPSVVKAAKDTLYYYPRGYVSAIRLFGADDECLTERRVELHYQNEPFEYSQLLFAKKEEIIKVKTKNAQDKGAEFFNGPNTRLLKWRATPRDGIKVALEQKSLELTLGPIGWYDYVVLNETSKEKLKGAPVEEYEYYIGLSDIISNKSVGKCRLSNLFDTATTIISSDGFVAYQQRTSRVSAVPEVLTSAVAENINRFLDDADPGDSKKNFNSVADSMADRDRRDESYQPKGVPHPFAAVRRGVGEELSPALLPIIGPNAIKLIGLSFDLGTLHPDALFALPLDLSKKEILTLCNERPGKDWLEGKLWFVRPDFKDKETAEALSKDWAPGGKASFVRTIELLDAVKRKFGVGFKEAFELLATAEL